MVFKNQPTLRTWQTAYCIAKCKLIKQKEEENNQMTITVAGEKKEYPEGLTVKELIEKEDVETPQYVTVTINDEFVESGAFETTEVKDGDEIEFLYFMGGGAR